MASFRSPIDVPSIRRLTVRDADAVLAFLEALDQASVRFFHPHKFDLDHVLRLLRGRLSGAVDAFGAHDADGNLIGYGWLWSMETQHPGMGVCVADGHRGVGIGKALVVRLLDEAILRGKAEVRLSVMPENAAAIALYRQLGFEVASTQQNAEGKYLCMSHRCDLSPSARAPVIRKYLQDADIRLVPYSHCDWAWVHTRHWHRHRYALIFEEVLRTIEQNPDFRWYCDNFACQMSAFLELKPALLPGFRRQVIAGRMDICGGYANVRPNMVGDETFVRNLVLGKRKWTEIVPEHEVTVHGDAVDVAVGHSQMPQLLRLGGFRYLRMWRPYGALSLKGIPNDFIWRGADGSEVTVSRGCYGGLWALEGAARVLADAASPDREMEGGFHADQVVCALWDADLEVRVRYADTPLAWLAVGCDDARPNRLIDDTPFDIGALACWWNAHENPPMRFATPTEYFMELIEHRGQLQTIVGPLDPCDVAYNAAWNGEQGLHQQRVVNDRLLVEAETFGALACCVLNRPAEETVPIELWEDHLITCAHATQWLYADDFGEMKARADRVRLNSTCLRDEAICAIARHMQHSDDTVCIVANPLPWDRDAVIEANLSCFGSAWPAQLTDATGNPLPHQMLYEHRGQGGYPEQRLAVHVRLPATGIVGIRQINVPTHPPAPPNQPTPWAGLDNGIVRLDVIEGRIMTLQSAESTGRAWEMRAPFGSEWGGIVVKEVATTEGPLHVGPIRAEHVVEWTHGEAVEDGPVRWRYRRRGQVMGMDVMVDIVLRKGSERVDFEVSTEWPGLDGFMAVRFPLPVPCRMVGDIPFGVETRDISGEPFMKDHWVGPHSMERVRDGLFYARSFVAVESPGDICYAVIGRNTDRYYLRHSTGRYLEHLLINSVVTLDEWEQRVEPSTLGGKGPHMFLFSLLPYSGGWQDAGLVRQAAEARSAPIVLEPAHNCDDGLSPVPPQAASSIAGAGLLTISPNAYLTACRMVDGELELRFHECRGEKAVVAIELPFVPMSARATDFLGQSVSGMPPIHLSGRRVEVPTGPWQIVTLRIGRTK